MYLLPLFLCTAMSLSSDIVQLAERAETSNWMDMYAAAPPHVREGLGFDTKQEGELAMVRSHIPFCHFNMVMHLGYPGKPTEDAFAGIDAFFEGKQHWVMVPIGQTDPPDLGTQLLARQYKRSDAWDRVILQNPTSLVKKSWVAYANECDMILSQEDAKNTEDWSAFIVKSYSMPPLIQDWLKALVGRKGWFHALLRNEQREVIMTRSLYVDHTSGWAWLGIDAPVPGVMALCFEEDQKVVAALLMAAAEAGAHSFVTDIEAPNEDHKGPAYERYGELGFSVAYCCQLFRKDEDL